MTNALPVRDTVGHLGGSHILVSSQRSTEFRKTFVVAAAAIATQ
ncbi:MAG TPA: hypothetical protein VF469_35475 [Kofleriaceae bacterium]